MLESLYVLESAVRHFYIRTEMGKNAGRKQSEVHADYEKAAHSIAVMFATLGGFNSLVCAQNKKLISGVAGLPARSSAPPNLAPSKSISDASRTGSTAARHHRRRAGCETASGATRVPDCQLIVKGLAPAAQRCIDRQVMS